MLQARAEDDENTIQEPLLNQLETGNVGSVERNLDTGEREEEEEENLPEVPFEPYKSYIKFFFHFVKWTLLLVIFDFIAAIDDDDLRGMKWWRSHRSVVLIINAVVVFHAARAIDRDVTKVDEEVRSQEGSGSENPPMDWNSYEYIYGKVARKVDVWLASVCQVHPGTTVERPMGTTSFVSHLCWILWAFLFASAFSETFEVGREILFLKPNNQTDQSQSMNSKPNVLSSSNLSNISHFPKKVQHWITDEGYRRYSGDYDFPTASIIFGGGEKPVRLDDRIFLSNHLLTELVAVDNHLEKREHLDISYPHMFISVQNSLDKSDHDHASQYCFLSKPENKNWDNCMGRAVHCVDKSKMENGKALVLKNATFEFSKQKEYAKYGCSNDVNPEAASYQDQVFFRFRKSPNYQVCHEVIQVDTTTMETSTIYQTKCTGNSDKEFVPFSYTLVFNGFGGLVVASHYMVVSRGMASGFFPLMTTFSFLLNIVLTFASCVPEILIIGTAFFHYLIFTDRRWRCLPAWVGKDVYIWSLYGWIFSILISDLLPFLPYSIVDQGEDWVLFCILITGVILGHPILQALGCFFLMRSLFDVIIEFEAILVDPGRFAEEAMIGLGMIVLGKWLSTHKEVIYARSQYAMWYVTKWLRIRFRRSLRRRS